ncbi:MAG: DUF1599 domain-containing protein [Saprospiraceae bacterium]|nr:DUF1599 domain-containing protein [Saprospiraceae bacterium]MCB9322638.1 DUF1599 domain-containing protein [Lewinellaceae bacterium]
MKKTLGQYDEISSHCRALFLKKHEDYGTSWRILRPSSLTDQMYIKAQRIRSIEEKSTQLVEDSIEGEYWALVNYGIIALVQLSLPPEAPLEMETEEIIPLYDHFAHETRELMIRKNHDYGEAWREMRISSITDLILAKILRIKQIEDNKGKTIASEGLDANYMDIIIYAIFALIKLAETKNKGI